MLKLLKEKPQVGIDLKPETTLTIFRCYTRSSPANYS